MKDPIAIVCIAAAAICALVLVLVISTPEPVRPDYTVTLHIDKSEKVEQAVSNAMHEVVRRDFILAELDVRRTLNGGFTVRCKGIERGNLQNLD